MKLIETNDNNNAVDIGITVNLLRGTRDWEHEICTPEEYSVIHFVRLDGLLALIERKLFIDLENGLI